VLPEAHAGNQAPGLPLPKDLVSHACSTTALPSWKAGPRTPAAQRLDSSVPLAVAMAPGSPVPASNPQGLRSLPADLDPLHLQQLPKWLLEAHAPTQVDSRASTALWTPDNSSPPALLTHGNPQFATQCQEPATTHPSEVNLRLQILLFLAPGGFLPTEHGGPASPLSRTAREPSLPSQRARMPGSPLREAKVQPATLQAAPEPLSPKAHRNPVLHTAPPCRRITSLLPRT
jgi:hypothetical protein